VGAAGREETDGKSHLFLDIWILSVIQYGCLCNKTVITQANMPAKKSINILQGLFQSHLIDRAFCVYPSEFSSCDICYLTLSASLGDNYYISFR